MADAVLFEGYLLYPYRASAQKNRLRWQFGVLTPSSDGTEPTRSRTEALLEPKPGCVLRIRLRFLQLQARTPLVDDPQYFPFEEGVPRQVDADGGARRPAADDPRRAARVGRGGRPLPPRVLGRARAGGRVDRRPARPLPRAPAAPRRDQRRRVPAGGAARGGTAHVADRRAHRAGRGGRGVGLGDRPAAVGPAVRRRLHVRAHLAGARRAARPVRPAAVVADHPARPPPARPGEHDQPLRRAGERRDPHVAHAHADRRGEGRGAGHRPARGRDHRRRRRDAAGDPGAPARGDPVAAARSAPTAPPSSPRNGRRGGSRRTRSTRTPTPCWSAPHRS